MGSHVAAEVMRLMLQRRIHVMGSRILVLGLGFKENCPDVRNSRVVDVVEALRSYNATVEVHDPWVNPDEAREEYGIELVATPEEGAYSAIVLAVAHRQFKDMGVESIRALGRPEHILYDVKCCLPKDAVDGRL